MSQLKTKKVGIITQARMTSTRLPGKILKEVNGKYLLSYHIDRLRQTSYPIFIATTTNGTDNPVVDFAIKESVLFYRGSEHDVLSRYYNCADVNNLDVIVRVTSDCPLISGELVKNGIEKYLELDNPQLYMSNALERTYPRGFDFEIFSFELLKEAFLNAILDLDKEHVTPYINRNRSGKVEFYHFKQDIDKNKFRITVDTIEDFELVKVLIEKYKAYELSYQEITNVLEQHPELVSINAHIEQKKS